LLAAYNGQLRAQVPARLEPGVRMEWDGPLLRVVGWKSGGFIMYRDLGGLDGPELDDLIARQVRFFAERDERFEWKLHGHDLPPDLPERLRLAGFVPEEVETVMIAATSEVVAEPHLYPGVTLREVTDRADFDQIGVFEDAVWGDPHAWLGESLELEQSTYPDGLAVVVAEHDGVILCAGWVRFVEGTDFATFWGGATLPGWRGQGIYRATVAYRANLAARRGFRYLEVDASSDSRPILERLGFVPVTATTPFIWSPSGS
jgi:GNAT superfamily N-acetyltransferase